MASNPNGKTIKKTTCHGCTRRCGLIVTVENGRPVKLQGDKNQPMSKGFFCPRGKAMVMEQPLDPLRLHYPLKRVGKRGEGKWEQISWEQALDEIAAKLKMLIAEHGPESIVGTLDCMISTTFASRRFLRELGTPNEISMGGQVCYANSVKIEGFVYGQDTVCDRANSRCTVIWGCNPSISKPEWFGYIRESKKKGGKVIAVDPFRTQTVELADLWLQIRPGSDGAMMLAWLNTIVNESLYDRDFVETWTNAPYLVNLDSRKMLRQSDLIKEGDPEKFVAWNPGAGRAVAYDVQRLDYETPQIKPPLTGNFEVHLIDGSTAPCTTVWELLKEHVESFTPEKVESITWVPAEKIRAAARMFATHRPGNFFAGFALDGIGPNSNECGRTRSILSTLVGNLDVQGGQVMLGPLPAVNSDAGTLPLEQGKKVIGGGRYKLWTQEVSLQFYKYQKRAGNPFHPRYGAHAPSVWQAILTGVPYPIKALLCIGSNPLVTGANVKRIEKALHKLDLIVVQDLYMTPTAELADYVTPAAMDDIENCRLYTGGPGSGWLEGHSLLAGEKAIDPPGEAKSDFEFVRELGVRLGQHWPWKTDEEYYDWQLQALGYPSFKAFHEKVQWVVPQPTYKKYEKRGFGTPSGKVELYSAFLQDLGYSPFPIYEEPPFSPFSTPGLWKEYPFIQGVMRLRYYYESCYRNLPSLRQKLPDPLVYMHPDAAEANGLKEGDWVQLESPSTPYKIRQKVKIFDGVDPRVIYPDFGWWFPEKSVAEELHGAWESNVNMLSDDEPENCCPMIGSWYINANLLKITKI